MRKSPEGSSTSTVPDSGFSTEKDISGGGGSGGGTLLLSPAGGQVRWPGQELRMASLSDQQPPDNSDELLGLLDVIHRKAVKLRAQQLVEAEWSAHGGPPNALSAQKQSRTLGAIHEHEAGASDTIISDHDTKDRTKRKLFSDSSGHEQLVDRISELENEALSSNFKVSKLESEISRISRQKELLEEQLKAAVNIKSELDSRIHDMHSQYVRSSKKDQAGIIHSVQILTGGGQGSLQSGDYVLSPSRSETNLRKVAGDNGSVNIEIRGGAGGQEMSRSQEQLLKYPGAGVGSKHNNTIVNLRQTTERLAHGRSVDGLNHLFRQRTDSGSSRPTNSRFFQNRMTGPPMTSSGHKLPPQLNRVLSNDKLSPKSRSVENLYDQRLSGSGLKPANSEISLQQPGHPLYRPLKSTQSEQVLTKIGRTDKVRLDTVMSQSVVSMPAELAKTAAMVRVKPNREKIRQVLATSSVLELQRQLLTTVMENEVRKLSATNIRHNPTQNKRLRYLNTENSILKVFKTFNVQYLHIFYHSQFALVQLILRHCRIAIIY